ncbi:trefoil factor 1-like [Talpa occidentalis]|uniref:trefoil factor 1-like n=1 Tax=Talpa occidentalis TaxID=50954 RepID=UPI0018907E68|nr:trefoil factor 1-like [Talpa occidentalis]
MEPKVVCVLLLVCVLAAGSLAQGMEGTCEMEPKERENCGYPGVTPQDCADRGCCFDNSVRGFPWCFHPRALGPDEEDCVF